MIGGRDNAAASSGKGVNARCKVAFVQKNYSQTHSHKIEEEKIEMIMNS